MIIGRRTGIVMDDDVGVVVVDDDGAAGGGMKTPLVGAANTRASSSSPPPPPPPPTTTTTTTTTTTIGVVFKKILKTLWVLVCFTIVCATPYVAYDMYAHDYQLHTVAWFVAFVFVALSLPITLYEVTQHLENYRAPRLQRHVIRILFMVPIYAIDGWFALRFKSKTIYFDTVRECYEAYVIYNFYTYCIVYLQEFCAPGLSYIVARKATQPHIWPLSMVLRAPRMGEPFLRLCRHGVINYVVIRPVTSLLAFIADSNGKYGDGQILNPWVAYPYLVFVNNLSQAWAMYCLILLYKVMYRELAPLRPFYKFVSVKAVVFFSFWQSMAIAVLVKTGVISTNDQAWASDYDAAALANAIQAFCICIEMFFAAIAHAYAFPPEEYNMGQPLPPRKFTQNVIELFDVRDVYHDIVYFAQQQRERLSGKYQPGGVMSPGAPLSRSNSVRSPRSPRSPANENAETATLLPRGAASALGDDQFEIIVNRVAGDGAGRPIAIDSISSIDTGLAPLHAEPARRTHDA